MQRSAAEAFATTAPFGGSFSRSRARTRRRLLRTARKRMHADPPRLDRQRRRWRREQRARSGDEEGSDSLPVRGTFARELRLRVGIVEVGDGPQQQALVDG